MTEAGLVVVEVGEQAPAELARALVDRAADTVVVWLGSSDGDPGLSDALASEVSRLETPPEVELVVGSWDVQGGRLLDVVAAMDRLRSPGGCPWDAEQTHESLAPYLVEEAHEVLEAIGSGDPWALAEELGDVLLQVVFHARSRGTRGRTASTSTRSRACSSRSSCGAIPTSSPTATRRLPSRSSRSGSASRRPRRRPREAGTPRTSCTGCPPRSGRPRDRQGRGPDAAAPALCG